MEFTAQVEFINNLEIYKQVDNAQKSTISELAMVKGKWGMFYHDYTHTFPYLRYTFVCRQNVYIEAAVNIWQHFPSVFLACKYIIILPYYHQM